MAAAQIVSQYYHARFIANNKQGRSDINRPRLHSIYFLLGRDLRTGQTIKHYKPNFNPPLITNLEADSHRRSKQL